MCPQNDYHKVLKTETRVASVRRHDAGAESHEGGVMTAFFSQIVLTVNTNNYIKVLMNTIELQMDRVTK